MNSCLNAEMCQLYFKSSSLYFLVGSVNRRISDVYQVSHFLCQFLFTILRVFPLLSELRRNQDMKKLC